MKFYPFVLAGLAWVGSTPKGAELQDVDPVAIPEARPADWLPFELFRDRWIFLRGTVNGVVTDMVLDSGAAITVIDRAEARSRGFRGGRRVSALGVGGLQEGRLHGGVFVELDGLRLSNLRIASFDLAEVGRQIGRDVPFLLGREAFEAAIIDIDYPNRRLAFRDHEDSAYAGSGATLPLVEFEGGHWAVQLDIEERAAGLFQLDTGSGETLTLFEGFTAENDLLEGRPTSVLLAVGVGGGLEVRTATLASVGFGGVRFERVPAAFHAGEVGVFAALELAGNLGAGVLERFRVIVDTRRGELHLELGQDGLRPFERDRSGLQTVWTERGLEVIHVVSGGPAEEAGWRVGTRILAVDGRPVTRDYWDGLYRWPYAAVGTVVVLRDQEGLERELVLSDYY